MCERAPGIVKRLAILFIAMAASANLADEPTPGVTLKIEPGTFTADGILSLHVSFKADHPIRVYSWRGHIYPILGHYLHPRVTDEAGKELRAQRTVEVIPKVPRPMDVVTAEEYVYPEPLYLRIRDGSGELYVGCLDISLWYETAAGDLDPIRVESNRINMCNSSR